MAVDQRREPDLNATAQRERLLPRPPEALEAVFAQHHPAVFRAAYRITGDAADAEDVLQTVFLRLLRREEPLDLGAGAGSYLHRAAVNAALDLVRARRRNRSVELDQVENDLIDESPAGPERQRGNRELKSRLRSALARLTPSQAEIFSLRYLEGVGNLEISRRLGSSQTAIAVILHRARHRLQKELSGL